MNFKWITVMNATYCVMQCVYCKLLVFVTTGALQHCRWLSNGKSWLSRFYIGIVNVFYFCPLMMLHFKELSS